ncbi:DHH family phosphoesterase [Camelliibacillus cellulosilyticus]|uniref:Cyclic-di-AMP phosphodiesterase n=1 Tax=Camelliibacillus cellulosilyticus TaxID=2174486 RepID=A0ABV9GQ24_9BACL
MSKEGINRGRNVPIIIALAIGLLFVALTAVYQWYLGLVGLIVLIISAFFIRLYGRLYKKDLESYVSTLSHRVKKVGEEALHEMPIGIVLYDDNYTIEWANHYMANITGAEPLISQSLEAISDNLLPILQGDADEEILHLNQRHYQLIPRREERLLYFFDMTEVTEVKSRYENDKTVFGIICLDNYDEVTQGMEDQHKSRINNVVTNLIKGWGTDNGIYLKRYSSEKFFAVFNQKVLRNLEKTRFDILDNIRESTAEEKIPLTLSIGVGAGLTDLTELGQMAQSALDLALGRGGDQVAIKFPSGKVKFYGGKTNPVEKRTRVRARVISHALSELIRESDQVLIMGHKQPDMDAIGSAIGIMKIAETNGKPAAIVLQMDNYGPGAIRLINKIKENEQLWSMFISTDDAIEAVTAKTLIVVVDTHKPKMVMEPKLLTRSDRVVIIDHHRRSEEFIEDPVLVYMEPYASSTAELVTELIEYQQKTPTLSILEASALLAGITVDTKNFTLRTGSRTFDAASFLRSHGADTILVQKLLRENLKQYNHRASLIRNTELYRNAIAIAVAKDDEIFDQVVLAQAADTLLSIEGVTASFAMSLRPDGLIGISARSLGDMNVQIIMESLNGGGHLTNAATQLDMTLDEAEARLKAAIDAYLEGGDSE